MPEGYQPQYGIFPGVTAAARKSVSVSGGKSPQRPDSLDASAAHSSAAAASGLLPQVPFKGQEAKTSKTSGTEDTAARNSCADKPHAHESAHKAVGSIRSPNAKQADECTKENMWRTGVRDSTQQVAAGSPRKQTENADTAFTRMFKAVSSSAALFETNRSPPPAESPNPLNSERNEPKMAVVIPQNDDFAEAEQRIRLHFNESDDEASADERTTANTSAQVKEPVKLSTKEASGQPSPTKPMCAARITRPSKKEADSQDAPASPPATPADLAPGQPWSLAVRRPRIAWTGEEIQFLLAAVRKHGPRAWNAIHQAGSGVFNPARRPVDLLTKYRLLHHESSFYRSTAREWVEILPDGTFRTADGSASAADGGPPLVISERFPYDAAMRFARLRMFSGFTSFRVTIALRGMPDTSRLIYEATLDSSKLWLRRITKKGRFDRV